MNDENVRWINLRGQAPLVDGRHAERADNVYLDKGVVRKRNGYAQTVKFDGPINGYAEVTVGGNPYVLVYAGTRFYLRDKGAVDERANYVDITLSGSANRVDVGRLLNHRVKVYMQNDRAYIVGCGDYLVLKPVGDRVELRRVEDEADTHIPTTTVGIGCKESEIYVATTVDEDSAGIFFVKDIDGTYTEVLLDGDEQLPNPDLTYYLRVSKSEVGTTAEAPNVLCSYRKNTLYGTAAGTSTYQLDVSHVDPDSHTFIGVDVVEEGVVRHYDLNDYASGTAVRCPVVGDDLSGVTLDLTNTTVSGVSTLHALPLRVGNYELKGEGGYMRWECSGSSASAWNVASLVLHTPTCHQIVATALRANLFGTYTVSWEGQSVTFPADFGVVSGIGNVFAASEAQGTLPLLKAELRCGGMMWGEIDYQHGTVTFCRPTTPVGVEDNVTVCFRYRERGDTADRVTSCLESALYGVGGNTDRLFVGGSAIAPTADYYSQSADWTYFAPEGGRVLGATGAIKAYVVTNLGLLTLLSNASPNAYWRTGDWETVTTYLDGTAFRTKTASFRLTKTADLPGVAGDGGAGALDSDSLYLAEKGVYRILTNALTDDKKAMRLSAPIDGVCFGEASTAIVHDLRYYVSTGAEVLVGDSRYRVAYDSDAGYEWTTYLIAGVRIWYVSAGVLCFGTDDGRLCRFCNGFEDVTFEDTASGQLTADATDSTIAFDRALPIDDGDELYLAQSLYARKAVPVDLLGNRVYVDSDAILHIYEGDAVHCVAEGMLGAECYVRDVDWGKCCFDLVDASDNPVALPADLSYVVCDLKGQRVHCRNVRDGTCSLGFADGAQVILFDGALPNALTARLVHRRPVVATYAAVTHALSTPDLTKVLLSATVEASSSLAGKATFSVRTSADSHASRVLGMGLLRYDWLDLGAFSFDGDFPRAYTVPIRLRFHYIQWQIQSTNAGDLAIRGVCLRYRYVKPAKGVSH